MAAPPVNSCKEMETVYIGLGSNLGNPVTHVLEAWRDLHCIPTTCCQALSSLYSSDPLGPADQPPYVNAAARIQTGLTPYQLLDLLHEIEAQHQRVRETHWGARTLDLDILLFGTRVIREDRLEVPHPQMHRRNFVLAPLLDLDPALSFPDGTSISSRLADCGTQGLKRWARDLSPVDNRFSL